MSRVPKAGDVITVVENGVTKVGRIVNQWNALYVLLDGVHRNVDLIMANATLGYLTCCLRSREEINTMISVSIADLADVDKSFASRLDVLSDQEAVTLRALLNKIK